MCCVPVGVVGQELTQPQLGCLDSPTPLESFPATQEWSHLLKTSLVIVHLNLNHQCESAVQCCRLFSLIEKREIVFLKIQTMLFVFMF